MSIDQQPVQVYSQGNLFVLPNLTGRCLKHFKGVSKYENVKSAETSVIYSSALAIGPSSKAKSDSFGVRNVTNLLGPYKSSSQLRYFRNIKQVCRSLDLNSGLRIFQLPLSR